MPDSQFIVLMQDPAMVHVWLRKLETERALNALLLARFGASMWEQAKYSTSLTGECALRQKWWRAAEQEWSNVCNSYKSS